MRKKQWEDLEGQENLSSKMKMTRVKNKVEGAVQKLLVFFKKNLNKIVNLDQKTCQKKTMIGKLGKNCRTSSLYKVNKWKLNKVSHSKSCNNSRLRSQPCCCKTMLFISNELLGFVSEIVSNLFLLLTRKLCFIKFCSTQLACNFIKKRLQHRFFPVKFAKFLRTSIFIEHQPYLLL